MKDDKLVCDNCKTKQNAYDSSFCKDCKNPLTIMAKRLFPEMIKPKKSYLETRI
jgi:rRNA maturation endonuclease Nob1